MKKKDLFTFAFGNFFRRKARSALTVLGVIIGTAAVIIMISIGIGMQQGFEDTISQYQNLREINVYKKWGNEEEDSNQVVGVLDDIGFDEISNIKHVKAISAGSYGRSYPIIKGRESAIPQIMGISAQTMKDFDYKLLAGRLLDETDVGTTNFVMCYDSPFFFGPIRDDYQWDIDIEDDAVHPFDPVDMDFKFTWQWDYGKTAVDTTKPKVKLTNAKCVGILQKDPNREWHENIIYMDVKGMQQLSEKLDKEQEKYFAAENAANGNDVIMYSDSYYGFDDGQTNPDGRKDIYDNFNILVDDTDNVSSVEKEIRKLGYETNSAMTYLNKQKEDSAFLRQILGAIGVVAFFVAALSIMNTMIMSIYERTREIGIMKVIGCKVSDIRTMFLIEAGIIGFIGGVVGIGASYGASAIVNKLATKSGGLFGYQVAGSKASIIPIWLDLAALVLAIVVGILSGLYPAVRATRLSALEAIKNE